MITLPASCSTWILPLLLLQFFISFQLLLSAPSYKMKHEFQKTVLLFEAKVKNCPESCDPGHRMNGSCSCFDFSVSPQECAFPTYFIRGLNSMHPNTSSLIDVPLLNKMLRVMAQNTDTKLDCLPNVNNTLRLVSPKSFSEELKNMMHLLNSS